VFASFLEMFSCSETVMLHSFCSLNSSLLLDQQQAGRAVFEGNGKTWPVLTLDEYANSLAVALNQDVS
jgi:hypothetical protein